MSVAYFWAELAAKPHNCSLDKNFSATLEFYVSSELSGKFLDSRKILIRIFTHLTHPWYRANCALLLMSLLLTVGVTYPLMQSNSNSNCLIHLGTLIPSARVIRVG